MLYKQIYEIDNLGYLKEILVKEFDEKGNCTEELVGKITTTDPPQGLYRAKWTGTEWVEDMSQEEIDALNDVSPTPTTEERIEALEAALLEVFLDG